MSSVDTNSVRVGAAKWMAEDELGIVLKLCDVIDTLVLGIETRDKLIARLEERAK